MHRYIYIIKHKYKLQTRRVLIMDCPGRDLNHRHPWQRREVKRLKECALALRAILKKLKIISRQLHKTLHLDIAAQLARDLVR